jgi:hypothetical protein
MSQQGGADYLRRNHSENTFLNRDAFRLLLTLLQQACGKRPDQLMLFHLTAAQLIAFLRDRMVLPQGALMERHRCMKDRAASGLPMAKN